LIFQIRNNIGKISKSEISSITKESHLDIHLECLNILKNSKHIIILKMRKLKLKNMKDFNSKTIILSKKESFVCETNSYYRWRI
jgi:hypothetical protein